MSAIQQFKSRLQNAGYHVNQGSTNNPQQAATDKTKQMIQSKSRSQSQIMPSKNQHVSLKNHQNQAHYQNLSRKAYQPQTSIQPGAKGKPDEKGQEQKKKIKLNNFLMNPIDQLSTLDQNNNAALNQKRENKESLDQVKELNETVDDSSVSLCNIRETLDKMKNKIASAQRKMNLNFGAKGAKVSNFDPENNYNNQKVQHNSDQLLKTEDHSDIKHSQKVLFGKGESTALMTGKTSSISHQTPQKYEASQFTLNILGESIEKQDKTPTQFQSNVSKTTRAQDTDEQGNRMSILPSAKRPRVPSTKKKDCTSTKKQKPKTKLEKEDNIVNEEFKNPLDKLKNQVKVMQGSKDISKDKQVRTNFVRLNMLKSYKPRMRGGVYQNKMMAKKKNLNKYRENMKRKLQIENAKNRDQVNVYGGLGKVGLDHNTITGEEDEAAALVPGFSASALKYVKKVEEDVGEIDEFLAEDLENMKDELQEIDEHIQDEEDEKIDEVDFDKPLYEKLPKTDEEYEQILKERFGHDTFKEGQLEAIKILLEQKKNALVVLATGGGKSLVFQYSSMFLPGLILVITPLISLMTDQLAKLPDFIPGAAVNSQQSYQMKKQIMQATVDKKIKVLFISPERFFIEDFTKFNRQISLVCVDEIHCASEWSHNFRPAYLKINDMIKEKVGDKQSVVLGLTATATKACQKSICNIFNIQHPDHIVTQPDLSRFNLQLSITRDQEKQKSLLTLLRSDSFKKLDSILIFATHKKTCDLLASFLTQNGINSQAYHAGKTDTQRQVIQKCFINNQVRALVCTIAFSMGIDKSDIQSVIHYDMPKSIENYVQEIGRAGRDGKLARCHLFLNNEDFFLIRRLILTDLLDNNNALKLTNKIIVEAKKNLVKLLKPELMATKKRKRKDKNIDEEGEEHQQIIEEFEHESELKQYYVKDPNTQLQKLIYDRVPDINPNQMYVFLDVKETTSILDLKREVVMTMLNSLEKLSEDKRFFKFEGILPGSVGLRFHKSSPSQLAEKSDFIKNILEIAQPHQGVYRCSMQKLAYKLNLSPFQIPRILYSLQNADESEITYEVDQECFVLKLYHIPYAGQTLDLSKDMLNETRRVEKNMVQKLNCMYFVARRVSMPSIENMLKREKNEDAVAMYKGFSKQLNELINLYFSITDENEMEIQIAGSEEERNIMMPLNYIDSHREKASIEVIITKQQSFYQSEIKVILREYHDAGQGTFDPNERMKPLDVVKVLMGIYSDRGCIKRFMNNSKLWAKFQEYDYEDISKVAQNTVNQFYLDQMTGTTSSSKEQQSKESGEKESIIPSANISKKRKLNE